LPTFEMTRPVPFSPEQMFAVVADVERYPEFLPLCEGLHVRSREEKGGESVLTATMTVGYRAIRESFTSRVTLRPLKNEIDVAYLDGPFTHLDNRWWFRDAAGGSQIHFFIDYAFASRMLGLVMGAVFDKAVRKYAEAFEERARLIYGRPTAAAGVPGER
jgi:coenzyme Q-binding protein COQ10